MSWRYRENKIYCGDYLDVQIHPAYTQAKGRGRKMRVTSDTQKKLNDNNAEYRMVRQIHTNFNHKDLALHLSHNQEPQTEEEAQRLVQNYLRRLKRLYAKQGIDLKYIWVMEKGKRKGRIHHHLVISGGVSRDEVERKWGLGYANTRRLQFTENGVAGLTHYMQKDPLLYRRYNSSKNLIKPTERENYYRFNRKRAEEIARYPEWAEEIEKYYPGYKLAFCEAQENKINKGAYIFMRLYKANANIIRQKAC